MWREMDPSYMSCIILYLYPFVVVMYPIQREFGLCLCLTWMKDLSLLCRGRGLDGYIEGKLSRFGLIWWKRATTEGFGAYGELPPI